MKMSKGFIIIVALLLVAGGFYFYFQNEGEKQELRRQIAHTQAVIEKKPEMPIELGKRDALLGDGEVVQLKSIFSRNLTVTVKCMRPGLGDQKTFSVELIPNQPKEIGHLEGWAFKKGDRITISHSAFEDMNKFIGE